MYNNWKYESNIKGMDDDIKLLEIIDMASSGEKVWAIKDAEGNRTPLFENSVNILPLDRRSCLLIGQTEGKKNLYVVENKYFGNILSYHIVDVENVKDLNKIVDVNEEHSIIECNEGKFFFNKKNLKKESDVFNNLFRKNQSWFFENTYAKDGFVKSIIGNVKENGKIGLFICYCDSSSITLTPLLESDKEYDVIDDNLILDDLQREITETKNRKEKNLNKILKMNFGCNRNK